MNRRPSIPSPPTVNDVTHDCNAFDVHVRTINVQTTMSSAEYRQSKPELYLSSLAILGAISIVNEYVSKHTYTYTYTVVQDKHVK